MSCYKVSTMSCYKPVNYVPERFKGYSPTRPTVVAAYRGPRTLMVGS